MVADYLSNSIQRFTPGGALLSPFALIDDPSFLESDSSANIYTTQLSTSVATRFDSAGNVSQMFTHASMTGALFGIDADAAGNVYVVDSDLGDYTLFKFTSDGTFINSTDLGSISGLDISIDEASSLLYMADQADLINGIKVFDISGAVPTLDGSIATPADAIIFGIHYADESGNILATEFGALSNDPRGLEFSSGGTLLEEYRPTNALVALDITTFVPEPTSLILMSIGIFLLVLDSRAGRGKER